MIRLLIEETDEIIRVRRMRILRLRLRDEQNPFNFPEDMFVSFYRLPKPLVHSLIQSLQPSLRVAQRNTYIPHHLQILAFLGIVANGGYQKNVGHDILLALSQTTISRCVDIISKAIDTELSAHYIRFPQSENEINTVKSVFYEKFGFPGIIGAIDCTHITIEKPKAEIEHAYYSGRKKAHTKNVQIICDYNLKILNINARYGGSAHDSYIFANSQIKTHLMSLHETGITSTWLIGDSGYEQRSWLMTPLRRPVTAQEINYNIAHKRSRNCIERCNGVLKGRFRILGKDRILRYTPQKDGTIINSCAILHNMMVDAHVPIDTDATFDDENNDLEDEETSNIDPLGSYLESGIQSWNRIISEYF